MSVSISEKKIKSKVKSGDRVVVVENIRYPSFESEKYKKLCEKMNEFYSSVAEKYSIYARNRLSKRMKKIKTASNGQCHVGMNYTVALCDNGIVSVVLDLTSRCGKTLKMRRFSQMWSTEKGDILPLCKVLKTDGKSKKKIYSLVEAAIKENARNPMFGYFDNYLAAFSKSFDIRNCFAVPKGFCFFVNAGILAPLKYGACNFVIDRDKLNGVLCGEPEKKNDENPT